MLAIEHFPRNFAFPLASIFGLIELSSFYFAIFFLNVTQNYVKQASKNIYVQHLRENSKSASTKRGNILWKRSNN